MRAVFDQLTNQFFKAVSFETGEKPDYEAIYDLFIDNGMLIKSTATEPEVATVRQFIEPRQKLVSSGRLTSFMEAEIAEMTDLFGNVAHRFCTYEKSGVQDGAAFAGRGMISIQFVMTPDGWKMSTMAWDDERIGLTVPDRYLPVPQPHGLEI